MTLEKVRRTTKARSTRARGSAFCNYRDRFLVISVVVAAPGLAPLAAPSYAQTVRAADAETSVTSPLPAKQTAAIQDESIRPFHIGGPEAQLVDLQAHLNVTLPGLEREAAQDLVAAAHPNMSVFESHKRQHRLS